MSPTLLFCIAENAKTVCQAVDRLYPCLQLTCHMQVCADILRAEPEQDWHGLFSLVESRAGPPREEKFKTSLKDDEDLETDLIGLEEEDCQAWALRHWPDLRSVIRARIALTY